jgi:hypothetical protein
MIATALLATTAVAYPVMAAQLLEPGNIPQRTAPPGPTGTQAPRAQQPQPRPAAAAPVNTWNGPYQNGRYIDGGWYPNNSAMVRNYCRTNQC